MNTAELEALRHAALTLPEKERAKLAGPEDRSAAEAWDIEICRRINEIESGNAELLDVAEVLSRARARIGS